MSEVNKEETLIFKQQLIFASFFHVSNELQIFLDEYLKADDLTGKQFLLMIEIGSFGAEGGLLKDVSKRSGSSHQNTKQIALKLEKKGFIIIEKDAKDGRAIRLRLTDKALQYWQGRTTEDIKMLQQLFSNISENNIRTISNEVLQIRDNIHQMKLDEKIKHMEVYYD